jgi:cytidylate kinase
LLAHKLGFEFLDTGAMYRAVTLAAIHANTDVTNDEAVSRLVDQVQIELCADRIMLDGKDVTMEIRQSAVTERSGAVADHPTVRRHLAALQRRLAEGRDIVCEGRDQGTIVFPHAACKFFLVADADERARRRQRESVARGETLSLEEVLDSQRARDQRDTERNIAPMVPAPDAVIIDSTRLTLDEVVRLMEQHVIQCRLGSSRSGTRPHSGSAEPD